MDDKEIKIDDEYVKKFYEEIREDYEKNSPTKTFAKIKKRPVELVFFVLYSMKFGVSCFYFFVLSQN